MLQKEQDEVQTPRSKAVLSLSGAGVIMVRLYRCTVREALSHCVQTRGKSNALDE